MKFFISVLCLVFVTFWSVAIDAGILEPHFARTVQKGKLVVALNNVPSHLNSAIHSGTLTGLVGAQLFAGLVRSNSRGETLPYLARRWQWSQDKRQIRFFLRPNAFFHDGAPISAEDVVFSLNIVRRLHPFSTMLSAVKKITAESKLTVVIDLENYHPALLQVLTPALTPILPKHIYGDGQDIITHPANWEVVGSGPFSLVSYIDGERILLKKFDDFFLPGKPYLKELEFIIFQGPSEIPMAMASGEVQLAGFVPFGAADQGQLEGNQRLQVITEGFDGIGAMIWLGFNLRHGPFDDERVRKAIALAIDKDFIVKNILGTNSQMMDGPIIPQNPMYSPPTKRQMRDVTRANTLLDEAGYTRDLKGRRMTIDVTSPPDATSLTMPLLTYLRHSLSRSIGVDLLIQENFELSTWARNLSTGHFQASLDIVFTWYDPVIGIHRTYDSHNIRSGITWSNTLAYKNDYVDRLLVEASQEEVVEKRKQIYSIIQNLIREDQPMVWLGTMPYATIADKHLKGLNESLWGLLSPMDQLYFENKEDL